MELHLRGAGPTQLGRAEQQACEEKLFPVWKVQLRAANYSGNGHTSISAMKAQKKEALLPFVQVYLNTSVGGYHYSTRACAFAANQWSV